MKYTLLACLMLAVFLEAKGSLCDSYKELQNTDTDNSFKKCFKLEIRGAGQQKSDSKFKDAYLEILQHTNKSSNLSRCNLYYVEKIDVFVTANIGMYRQPIGGYDTDKIYAQQIEEKFLCTNSPDSEEANTIIKKQKGPVSSSKAQDCIRPDDSDSLYNGKTQMLSMTFPPNFQPQYEIWALWSYDATNKLSGLSLDYIAEITYRNNKEVSKAPRTKMEGVMGSTFELSEDTKECDRISTPGKASRPYKTRYSTESTENLCRCLQFPGPQPPQLSAAFTPVQIEEIAKCLDFSFDLTTLCAVATAINTTECPSNVTIDQIHEVIFSSYSEKGFPYGRWGPVVDGSTCNDTNSTSDYYNHFWKTEKCFYSRNRAAKSEFYQEAFGESDEDYFPGILRLIRRAGNQEVFGAKFFPPDWSAGNPNRPEPHYIPTAIQLHSHFLVSGTVNDSTGVNNPFHLFIPKHKDYSISATIESVILQKVVLIDSEPPLPAKELQQLNEEYFDELNFIFKKDKGNVDFDKDKHNETVYTCATAEPVKHQVCKCFSKSRLNIATQDIEDLISGPDKEIWLKNDTKTGGLQNCFDLNAKVEEIPLPENPLPNDIRTVHAVVLFRHHCPLTLEVRETVISALSHNGLPFGTKWDEVRLGFNIHPEDDKWISDTCLELALPSTTVRETWVPFIGECDQVDHPLRLDQQLSSNQKNGAMDPVPFLISNRPLAGSKRGTDTVKDKVYGFCGFFEWSTLVGDPVQAKSFEFQFVAQVVVEKLTVPPVSNPDPEKFMFATVRSPRYTIKPLPTRVNHTLLSPTVRTSQIDLNPEFYEQIIYEPTDSCVPKPPGFDELNDELCTCFFDHSDRGAPKNPDTDITLEQQFQTVITTKSLGEPWKVIVKIEFREALNRKYGPYELVVQALTPIDDVARYGIPVGRWGDQLYVGPEKGCSAKNIKYGKTLTHECTVSIDSKYLFGPVSNHSETNHPNIFHFQNPWLDDYLFLCMEWEYFPNETTLLSGNTDQYIQIYSQIIFEERAPANKKRTKTYYSTPVHARENFHFTSGGKEIYLLEKKPYQHDDDFRVKLHMNYKKNERQADCVTGNPNKLPLPIVPRYDTSTCTRFHPFSYVTRIDLDDLNNTESVRHSNCFTLDAYPLKVASNLHIRFRQYDKTTDGPNEACKSAVGTEVLIQALDQDGNPIGRGTTSFSVYDAGVHNSGDPEEQCTGEDVVKDGSLFADTSQHICLKYTRVPNFPEDVAFSLSRTYQPTIIHASFLNSSDGLGGIDFTWSMDPTEYQKKLNLTLIEIQFTAEVFVPDGRGLPEGKVFIVRTPKYSYNLNAKDLPEIPKCHDDSANNSVITKIDKPTNQSELDEYNIHINQDQFRACSIISGLAGCLDNTHDPAPKPITNPPITVNRSTFSPDPIPTMKPRGDVPEKIFHGCLTTKACFASGEPKVPKSFTDCIERVDCKHLVAYGRREGEDNSEDEIVMELYGQTQGWTAVGFSHDKKMGRDYVVECVRADPSGTSQVPDVYHSWNHPVMKRSGMGNNKRLANPEMNIRIKERLQTPQAIYCKFYIKKHFLVTNPWLGSQHEFNLRKTKYCLLTAWSDRVRSYEADGNIGMHLPNQMFACNEPVLLSRQFTPSETQVYYLQLHGIFMSVAWVFFMSVGNFIGRYYKEIFPDPSFFKMRLWHLLHLVFAVLGLLFMVIAVGFHIAGIQGWQSLMGRNVFHAVTGYFVLFMFACNFAMAPCLKAKSPDRSAKLGYFHMFIAYLIQTLSSLMIAEAHKIPFSSVSCVLGYMGLAWMILYIFLNVFMSYHYFWVPCITGNPKDGDSQVDLNAVLTQSIIHQDLADESENYTGRTVRIQALVGFALIAFLFMVTISGIIYWPPEGPCYVGEMPLYFEKDEANK